MTDRPRRVALVACGLSNQMFLTDCGRHGGPHALFDEVWVVNAMAPTIRHDRAFIMDDLRDMQRRGQEKNLVDLLSMEQWARTHPGPIYTSRAYPEYPGSIDFPLDAVANDLGHFYFNTTLAYAIGYATWLKVEALALYGCDFTYPNAHHAESGRACAEFHLREAMRRGMVVNVAKGCTLLDMHKQGTSLYGYVSQPLVQRDEAGRLSFQFAPFPPIDQQEA